MCAPCKIILNQVDNGLASGGSVHEGVARGVQMVLGELPAVVQNELSRLDIQHVRARMDLDRRYFDSVVEVLSKFAGVDLAGGVETGGG